MEAFKQLKKNAIVVYLASNSAGSCEVLSPIAAGRLRSPEIGNIIPQAIVLDVNQQHEFGFLAYKQMKDPKKFKNLNKLIKTALEGDLSGCPAPSKEVWLLKNSLQGYEGEFDKLIGEKTLVLKPKPGKKKGIKIALEKLSEGAQNHALILAGVTKVESTEDVKKPTLHPIESWASAKNNKVIQARFVSLTDGTIRLKKPNGQIIKFSVDLLSETSKKHAQELAAE